MSATINPFIANIKKPAKRRSRKVTNLDNVSITIGDKIIDVINPTLHSEQEVATIDFIKIHKAGITNGFGGREILVYNYILDYCIKFNCDYFFIDIAICAETIKVSLPTVYSTLKKLIANEVIKEREPKVYWINPFLVYRGSLEHLFNRRDYELNLLSKQHDKATPNNNSPD